MHYARLIASVQTYQKRRPSEYVQFIGMYTKTCLSQGSRVESSRVSEESVNPEGCRGYQLLEEEPVKYVRIIGVDGISSRSACRPGREVCPEYRRPDPLKWGRRVREVCPGNRYRGLNARLHGRSQTLRKYVRSIGSESRITGAETMDFTQTMATLSDAETPKSVRIRRASESLSSGLPAL